MEKSISNAVWKCRVYKYFCNKFRMFRNDKARRSLMVKNYLHYERKRRKIVRCSWCCSHKAFHRRVSRPWVVNQSIGARSAWVVVCWSRIGCTRVVLLSVHISQSDPQRLQTWAFFVLASSKLMTSYASMLFGLGEA